MPSDDFFVACHGFENEFKSFHDNHKNGMDQNHNVIERMRKILVKAFPSRPEDILLLSSKLVETVKYLTRYYEIQPQIFFCK